MGTTRPRVVAAAQGRQPLLVRRRKPGSTGAARTRPCGAAGSPGRAPGGGSARLAMPETLVSLSPPALVRLP